MESKFKAGDRVAVYFDGNRVVGEVASVNPGEDFLRVSLGVPKYGFPALDYIWAHPKQCRRLVKKARRMWVLYRPKSAKDDKWGYAFHTEERACQFRKNVQSMDEQVEILEFVEAKKK